MIGAEYIPALTVAVALAAPLLTETAKKLFGKEAETQKSGHDLHTELMAELVAAKADAAKEREDRRKAEEKMMDAEEERIRLLKESAGKDMLISALTDLFKTMPAAGKAGRPDSEETP